MLTQVLQCGYAAGRVSAEPSFVEMGEMEKGSFQVCLAPLHAGKMLSTAYLICPLEFITYMTIFSQVIENRKSRMNREVHVRLGGKEGVKFPCLTRLCAMRSDCFQA